jgi:hypothetical protein
MAESILEQLAAWHAAAIAGITVHNGYPQTLDVKTENEYTEQGVAITDLSTVCFLGDGAIDESESTETSYYMVQDFVACVYLLGRGTTGLPVETRQAQVIASMQKCIGDERAAGRAARGIFCDGRAAKIHVGPHTVDTGPELLASLVSVPVVIEYWVNKNDPTIQ